MDKDKVENYNKSGKSRRKIFKLNEDDVLEILTEHLALENGFKTFASRGMLLGTLDKNFRAVVVIGDLDDDDVASLDLTSIDKDTKFNGTHT